MGQGNPPRIIATATSSAGALLHRGNGALTALSFPVSRLNGNAPASVISQQCAALGLEREQCREWAALSDEDRALRLLLLSAVGANANKKATENNNAKEASKQLQEEQLRAEGRRREGQPLQLCEIVGDCKK